MAEWCSKCNKYHDMTTAGICPQAGPMISPVLTADRAAAVDLVRELRDELSSFIVAFDLRRMADSPATNASLQNAYDASRAIIPRADAFLRGERSNGAEVARQRRADFIRGAEWNAMQEDTVGRLQFYAEAEAEAARRYPEGTPGEEGGRGDSL